MKPILLIYGHDGFDFDVVINLKSFYKELGFKVIFSRTLHDADLLCVVRPPYEPIIGLERYSQVHIFDYVCSDIGRFFSSLTEHPSLSIFTPSSNRRAQILLVNPSLKENVEILLPPVYTKHWVSRKKLKAKYLVTHIGNYKPYYAGQGDPYAREFMKQIDSEFVHVWGRGWPNTPGREIKIKKASLYSVSAIYKKSLLALGMMYPFQRDLTISGRYWHAPLNGAYVLSEPNFLASSIPGVLETTYENDFDEVISNITIESRNELQKKSKIYWDENYRDSLQIVGNKLNFKYTFNSKFRFSYFLSIIVNYPGNMLRELRYKLRLDK